MTLGQVDTNLRRFYAEARTKSGEMYGRATLLGFRHAIERHLNLPPNNRNIKMSTDPRFQRSNLMLDAQLVNMKRSGKDNPVHKPTIEDEDMTKLRSSETLSLKSPKREGGPERPDKVKFLKFEVDASGRKYVTMVHDELTKNHQGGLKDHTTSTEKYARMYESNHENDGYKALQLYLTKLNPTINALFQYPKKELGANRTSMPLGFRGCLGVGSKREVIGAVVTEIDLILNRAGLFGTTLEENQVMTQSVQNVERFITNYALLCIQPMKRKTTWDRVPRILTTYQVLPLNYRSWNPPQNNQRDDFTVESAILNSVLALPRCLRENRSSLLGSFSRTVSTTPVKLNDAVLGASVVNNGYKTL
ncbi:hypothetical protein QZH41_000228 [Actinostola sp. cb2023]|nr:hypothetical protein QZH41_000228 [Actinostola sp. cb2023]